jgi:hypothetical protein
MFKGSFKENMTQIWQIFKLNLQVLLVYFNK